jgi:hypothetical protein
VAVADGGGAVRRTHTFSSPSVPADATAWDAGE